MSGGYSLDDVIQGQEAPSIANYEAQGALAQNEYGLLGAGATVQEGELSQQTGYGEALIGLQEGANQINQQYAGLQYGDTLQSLGLQSTYLGSQEQVAAGQQQLAQGTGGIGGGGYAAQLANLQFQYPIQKQELGASQAGTGTLNTVGGSNAQNTLAEQQAYNVGNVENASKASALAYQGQQAGFAYQGGEIGLQRTEAGQQYQNTEALLQNAAQALGINVQQLQSELSSGLSEIGINTGEQQDQLLLQVAQAQAGEAQGVGAIQSQEGALGQTGTTGGPAQNTAQVGTQTGGVAVPGVTNAAASIMQAGAVNGSGAQAYGNAFTPGGATPGTVYPGG